MLSNQEIIRVRVREQNIINNTFFEVPNGNKICIPSGCTAFVIT